MGNIDKNIANKEDAELRIYEIGYNMVPTIPEEDVAPAVDVLRSAIESNGGVILSEGAPELTKLAYPMQHIVSNKRNVFDTAYFGWIKFEMGSDYIAKVKDEMERNENIIRFIIIKTVREDTLSRKYGTAESKQATQTPEQKEKGVAVENDKDKELTVSEKEVDKAIEELIV